MNKMKKILALVLVLLMVLPVLAACKRESGDDKNTPEPGTTEVPKESGKPDESANPTGDEYTYNLYMDESPSNWNPHAWQMNNENELISYLEGPLVDISVAEDGKSWTWVYEMATDITDITATYSEREKWLDKRDEDGKIDNENGKYPEKSMIYQIKLNPDAKWQDGTPINADDYMWSMERLLSSEMKNYRSNTYTSGENAIKNGLGYFNNDKAGKPVYANYVEYNEDEERYYPEGAEGSDAYINLSEPCTMFGVSLSDIYNKEDYAKYKPYLFTDGDVENGTDLYAAILAIAPEAEKDFVKVTDEIKAVIVQMAALVDDSELAWEEYCFYDTGAVYPEVSIEDVGLIKVDDYTIIYVLENPNSEFNFRISMAGNWIVKRDLYEAGYKKVENLTTTDYGTAIDKYSATGAYRLDSFEPGKQFVLVRNENWYGWTDGKHEGQYQTTRVVYDIVAETATAMQLFESGKLDEIALDTNSMEKYRMSSNLLKTDDTYTMRFVFASDLNALKTLEEQVGDGNKRILHYKEFREAFSYMIDRTEFCMQGTAGYKPSYSLLNGLYYYDIENDPSSIYRNTDEAKAGICRHYGIEWGEGTEFPDVTAAYNSITGYDVGKAKELFEAAADAAIAEGQYTEGEPIVLRCQPSNSATLDTDDTKQEELLNKYINAATQGTKLEGKVTIKFVASETDRYDAIANGRIEMIRGAWGGAALYPFRAIGCYCDPTQFQNNVKKIHESCGWDPTVEKLTIPIDGEDVTDTFANWVVTIYGAGKYATDPDKCLLICSYIEQGVLDAYQCVPFGSMVTVGLFSNQIKYYTLTYDYMYGYGGLRLMTYNYTDAEWDEYIAENGGAIDYTE